MNRTSSDWENGWISLAFFLCSTRKYMTKLTARRKAGIAARSSSDAVMRRLRNNRPVAPRIRPLNKGAQKYCGHHAGWYRWFIIYLSRMPETAPIMYPSTQKMNQSSIVNNRPFITTVYKKSFRRILLKINFMLFTL
jgi:hypothetical protein